MYNQNPALVSYIFCVSNRIFMSQLMLNRSELLRKLDSRETSTTFLKHCSQPFNLLKGDVVLDLAATILCLHSYGFICCFALYWKHK